MRNVPPLMVPVLMNVWTSFAVVLPSVCPEEWPIDPPPVIFELSMVMVGMFLRA